MGWPIAGGDKDTLGSRDDATPSEEADPFIAANLLRRSSKGAAPEVLCPLDNRPVRIGLSTPRPGISEVLRDKGNGVLTERIEGSEARVLRKTV